MSVNRIISGASNVKGGQNPPFTIDDFKAMYPQFFTANTSLDGGKATSLIPDVMMDAYLEMAHASVKYARFRKSWKVCIGLFIAHFITLYLRSMANPEDEAAAIAAKGVTKGLVSSKSVDGVSVSYDFSQIANDLDGWAAWTLTEFGVQYATFAKLYRLPGMYIY